LLYKLTMENTFESLCVMSLAILGCCRLYPILTDVTGAALFGTDGRVLERAPTAMGEMGAKAWGETRQDGRVTREK